MKSYEEKLKLLMECQMEIIKDFEKSGNEPDGFLYASGLYNGMEVAKALYLDVKPEFFNGVKIERSKS